MQFILVTIASTLAALGDLLVSALSWLGRSLADVLRKLVTQPIGLAVRVHWIVVGVLLILFLLAEALDIWHRVIMPMIHASLI